MPPDPLAEVTGDCPQLAPRSVRRIVAVQGTVQLTSAIAALRAADRGAAGASEHHLLIHNLACPEAQADEFAACIARLARRVAAWESIRFVTMADIRNVKDTLSASGTAAAANALQSLLGISGVDELVLGQNLLVLNYLLTQAFPEARPICYGDAIGLNFSPRYYRPPQDDPGWRGAGRRFERLIRHRIKRLRGIRVPSNSQGIPEEYAVRFDRHYLLLPNQFDQHVDDFEQLDPDDFRDLFAAYVPEIESAIGTGADRLAESLAGAAHVVVLLTSNFSETKRMTMADEVDSCIDLCLRRGGGPGSALVIKPHPRDSREKIDQLKARAKEHFGTVMALDDPWTFYTPFESIFARSFVVASVPRPGTRVVCTSSAGLSLEYLYGQECDIGFGEQTVRRCFAPKWQALRLRHEADLRRIVDRIRAKRMMRHVA